MALSKLERLLLANQYRILGLLDEGDREFCKDMQDALESGYSDFYEDTLFERMAEELSPEESAFVRDALDVYGVMQRCYEGLDDKSGIEESRLNFPGFDGNHEGGYLAYADHLRRRERRFDYVKLSGFDGLNSHAPFADRYKRMVNEWKKIPSKRRYDALTKEEILSILNA